MYCESMKNALTEFCNPTSYDRSDIDNAFAPFKEIVHQLSRSQRKLTYFALREISPILDSLRSSSIPLPGYGNSKSSDGADGPDRGSPSSSSGAITIQSFESRVAALPTKTKPKKIILVGSDGQHYYYLLKGREDLHLDERMMQLLTTINQLLNRDYQTRIRGKIKKKHGEDFIIFFVFFFSYSIFIFTVHSSSFSSSSFSSSSF